MARDGILLDNFSGGLNNVTDASLIADNEMHEALNVVLTKNGKAISRFPFLIEKAKPTGATTIKPLGYFRNEDGVVYMVVSASNNKTWLYRFSNQTWTDTGATFAAADMTTYYNRLYLVNPAGAGGYYSKVSGSYTFTTIAAMPAGNQIHYTKGRIYISSRALGNTSTIRYSDITAIGFSIDSFPTSNVIDVNEGDGELLLKIVEGNNELFLFRSNSTWRLAFGASAEPTDGTLTLMSSTIGVDNEYGVAVGENYLAVMYAGTLYRFAGYNFYPINDANKVVFETLAGGYSIPTAVSKVGPYLLAWYYGSIYCFDTEAGAWTQWTSTLDAAFFMEAPRGTLSAANEAITAFGVGASTSQQSLLKFALEHPSVTSNETIKCKVTTRTYDAGLPTKFKRLFGWELLTVAVNSIKASITAIESEITPITWKTLQTYTWATANSNAIPWTPVGTQPVIINGLASSYPKPQVLKVSGKTTFKRAYFTIEFSNNGTAAQSPSRLDGIVLYLTAGRRLAMEQ